MPQRGREHRALRFLGARHAGRERDRRGDGNAYGSYFMLIAGVIVLTWINRGFGVLSEERLLVAASALIIVGLQILFSSFLISILGLRRRDADSTDVQS